jgi:Ca2+-binding RTX toxin-like protein
VNGTYLNVPLTNVTGTGTGATANITVAGNAVTTVTIVNAGSGYVAGNTLTANNANLGGAGAGFQVAVNTIANYEKLTVNALGGNDSVTLAALTVPLGDPDIFGGIGDDLLVGSPIADNIFGGAGNDVIQGLGGVDNLYGEVGNDQITGGTENDNMFGGDDGDTLIWNNGDGTDVMEGGAGTDTTIVNGRGTAVGDVFTINANAANPTRVDFRRITTGPFGLDIAAVENLAVNGGLGADSFTVGDLYTTDLRNVDLDAGI